MTRWWFIFLILPLIAVARNEESKVTLTKEDSQALRRIAGKTKMLLLSTPDESLTLQCSFENDSRCTLTKNPPRKAAPVKRLDGFGGTTIVLYERAVDCTRLRKLLGSFKSREELALTSSNEKFFRVPRLQIKATNRDCEWQANFNPSTGNVERER